MKQYPQNKNEVLRYLGYKNQELGLDMEELIQESMEEMRLLVRARYIYKEFKLRKDEDQIILNNSSLKLQGQDIKKHLSKSGKCILMAVTLGSEVDNKIRYYERVDMTRALILDACATAAIEEVCDEICLGIETSLAREGKGLIFRYSPGYGDLPISIQKDFLAVLNAEKTIGLTANQHSILLPRKSVTAILGIVKKEDKKSEQTCLGCNKYPNCIYSKEDGKCGN